MHSLLPHQQQQDSISSRPAPQPLFVVISTTSSLCAPHMCTKKTYNGFAEKDNQMFVVTLVQDELSFFFKGTNTLLVFDDFAAMKDIKGRATELVSLDFNVEHIGISIWVVISSSPPSPSLSAKTLSLSFYTPTAKNSKEILLLNTMWALWDLQK